MYHEITIVGNLGRKPEMRYTPSGQAVTNFSVASSDNWTDKEGNKRERTIWFRVSTWGKLAEICNQYLNKGSKVLVAGALVADDSGGPRVWTNSDGEPRASFEVNARVVRFLSSPTNSGEPGGYDSEDEIPF